jgi:hypothetical protein
MEIDMASDDNVVKMPDPLERRAQKIEAALDRQDDAIERGERAADDWRAATLDLAIEVAAAKAEFNNNTKKFGEWRKGRFGDNRLDPNVCAALVRWGADPEGTRKMLAGEKSQSVRVIDLRVSKTANSPSIGGSKSKSAHAALQANEATGTKASHKEVARALGVSESTVTEAARDLKAARTTELGQIYYTKAQDAHVEARVKIAIKAKIAEYDKLFEARVTEATKARIDLLFPDLEKLREDAKRNEKYYRELIAKNALFTEDQVMDIVKACHPDNSASREVRNRAFIAVNAKKLILMGKV